jgi:hypothetical protein
MSQPTIQLYPVYLNSVGFKAPDKGTYYLVCQNGTYLRAERAFGSAFVKVKDLPFLQSSPASFSYDLPPLPGRIIASAKKFFETVFKQHRSESYLTLMYSHKLKEYRLWCPKQEVSYASVDYERLDTVPFSESVGNPDGPQWQDIGTIHSHCDFSAFHSGTDISDEDSFDGLHITIGHVNDLDFSLVSSLSVCQQRKEVDPLTVIDGIAAERQDMVEEKGSRGGVWMRRESRYQLSLSQEDKEWCDQNLQAIVDEWMTKVSHRPAVEYKGSWTPSEYKGSWTPSQYTPRHTPRSQTELPFSGSISSSEWQQSDFGRGIPKKPAESGFFSWLGKWKTWCKGD